MKKIFALIMLAVLALTGCQNQFRPQSAKWSLDGVTVTAELKKREEIPELGALLYLTVANHSKSDISIRQTRPLDEFKILVHSTEEPAKEIALTAEWRDKIKEPVQRHNYQVIAPGESFTYDPVILKDIFMIGLGRTYKMKIAGTFYVKETKQEEIYLIERIRWYN